MTSTTGKADTTQHPDVSEISDLTEGLLSPSRSAAVRRHLDGCPLCADVRTSLEEIRGLLGTLPGPPRMPAEIAGRIDAALAAEALLQATAPENGSPVSRETSRPRTEPLPSGAPSPAAERPAGRPTAATGPGRPGKPRRRRIALVSTLGAAFAAAVLGTSLLLSQGGGSPTLGSADGAKKADARSVAMSPFSGTPVDERVHALLGEQAGAAKTPQGIGPESMSAAEGTTSSPQRNRDTAVPGCVLAGTGRTDAVLAHERGEYQGNPAYLLVLTDPTDSTRVQAFVLDASCADLPTSTGSPAADLLLSETYPRS
ncbi:MULTISPECIES: zf-HC2 domain-containing protein [unclassified Streptomyces]|uniref:zf-HC2 domain-containing protein n=1 Tax=unclassified Streptomyces TaxID=2593676 RepID=UPI000F78ED8C|nr:anti-sigma factor [Streptomyces sp. WAC01280]RSS53926.1 zf-HC2 domain-containing protein [Streptomyces sp. WAC01280]